MAAVNTYMHFLTCYLSDLLTERLTALLFRLRIQTSISCQIAGLKSQYCDHATIPTIVMSLSMHTVLREIFARKNFTKERANVLQKIFTQIYFRAAWIGRNLIPK